MLDHLTADGSKDAFELFTARLATMACKAAVKGNHSMSPQEADKLIDELLTLENPYNCPHGRPTIIAMSKTEIEKNLNVSCKIPIINGEIYEKPLIVLTGPTAVGKTKLSIALAKAVNGEIISADSMQVYRHMDIGSAKITPEEMDGVPHHLVDVLEPTEDFNIVLFQQMAKEAMEKIYDKGRIPILVGGTGFYIQAVTRDIDFTSSNQDDHYRRELEELAEQKGPSFLHDMLAQVDPKSAQDIHENNVKRVIRALEFYKQNGTRISEHNEEQKEHTSPMPWHTLS